MDRFIHNIIYFFKYASCPFNALLQMGDSIII